VRDEKTEVAKVQFELKSQTSTPPEVKAQHETTMKDVVVVVYVTVADCTTLFKKSMEVITTL